MSNVVMVPASKYVSYEMRVEFGHIPPLLLNIQNKTLLHHLRSSYQNHQLYVGAYEGIELVDEYISKSKININLINVGQTKSLGETIYQLMANYDFNDFDTLRIHFGDTLLADSFSEDSENFIYVTEVTDSWRWTVIDNIEDLTFIDKESREGPNLGVIGIFNIKKPNHLKKILEENLESQSNIESFYHALSEYHKQFPLDIIKISSNRWIDLGHLDRWNNAKAQTRSFNETIIDPKKGTLIKHSENKQKLIHEIKWYLNLPSNLQYTIPRIFECSLDESNPFVMMEYYAYPTLAERYISNNLDLNEWKKIFTHLQFVLEEFKQYEDYEFNLMDARYKMYVTKCKERLLTYIDSVELPNIEYINNQKVCSIYDCVNTLEEVFWTIYEEVQLDLPKTATVMHGDFCFSNILYDIKHGIIRTIDPRGSFDGVSIYGDHLYDIAKLSHSVRGFYDFIVREQFHYSRNSNRVSFEVFNYKKHHKIVELFDEMFLMNPKIKLFVDFIESTLFLSMLPLHADSPYRQQGILTTGLLKYTNILKQVKVPNLL